MTSTDRRASVGQVLALAGPAIVSYLLNNAYRINDQFWIQGLGGDAHAALGAVMYVAILNFASFFLAGAGALALVARARGAGNAAERDAYVRHALLFAVLLGGTASLIGPLVTAPIVDFLELQPGPAGFARSYLASLYVVSLPMALAPTVDHVFFGLGNAWIPMLLQSLSVALNWFLNPALIYGVSAERAVDAFGAESSAAFARWLVELDLVPAAGLGAGGAALATGISRGVAVALGILALRFGFGVRVLGSPRARFGAVLSRSAARIADIARVSAPVCISIAIYAGVYWALLKLVMSELAPEATAGLGLGFQVFEGIAFPCYVGIGSAVASLVGQSLGAGSPERALAFVKCARQVGRVVGVLTTSLFLLLAGPIAALFTDEPAVLAQTLLYVRVLAFSQFFVAVEAVNERVLLGAGFTRPILVIGALGNALRVPLAWALALGVGLGPAGVWWAINASTWGKAFFYWREVQRGRWLEGPRARAGGRES